MTYNIVDTLWFNDIGLVKVYDEYVGYKYYIGKAKGLDEHEDAQSIAAWGTPVYPSVIQEMFGNEDQQ